MLLIGIGCSAIVSTKVLAEVVSSLCLSVLSEGWQTGMSMVPMLVGLKSVWPCSITIYGGVGYHSIARRCICHNTNLFATPLVHVLVDLKI